MIQWVRTDTHVAGNCSNFLVESLTLFHKSDLLEQRQSIPQIRAQGRYIDFIKKEGY